MPGELDSWPSIGRDEKTKRTSSFQVSNGRAVKDLKREMDRLDPDDWKVYTGTQHTRSDGLPLHDANPDNPGFAVKWTKDGDVFAVGCDRFTDVFDNLRMVTLWVRETRKRSNRPVLTGSDEFAAAQLPPGEDSTHDTEPEIDDPYEELNIQEDAPDHIVEAAFEHERKTRHPDSGGTAEAFKRAQKAYEMIQEERDEEQVIEAEG